LTSKLSKKGLVFWLLTLLAIGFIAFSAMSLEAIAGSEFPRTRNAGVFIPPL